MSVLIAFTGFGSATTITLDDPFPGSHCAVDVPGCDVVGLGLNVADIQRAALQSGPTETTVELRHNYNNGDVTLSRFAAGNSTLFPGDLFLSGPGFIYGIALSDRPGFLASTVYRVTDPAAQLLTAEQALGGDNSFSYRNNAIVWMGGSPPVATGVGLSISNLWTDPNPDVPNDGFTNAFLLTTIVLEYSAGSTIAKQLNGNGLALYFASTTGANDIIGGFSDAAPVPEPGTWTLAAIGFTLLAYRRLRRGNPS